MFMGSKNTTTKEGATIFEVSSESGSAVCDENDIWGLHCIISSWYLITSMMLRLKMMGG